MGVMQGLRQESINHGCITLDRPNSLANTCGVAIFITLGGVKVPSSDAVQSDCRVGMPYTANPLVLTPL